MSVDKQALVGEMESLFGSDRKRIDHAHKVTSYAEHLLMDEKADPEVVIPAAVLHDIGIHAAEEKYGSPGGKFQEIEGPPIAREIMERLGMPGNIIDEVCLIIGNHHSPGRVNTVNFGVLYDADWLVNLRDEYDITDRNKLEAIIDRVFLTPGGRMLARKIYLEGESVI